MIEELGRYRVKPSQNYEVNTLHRRREVPKLAHVKTKIVLHRFRFPRGSDLAVSSSIERS